MSQNSLENSSSRVSFLEKEALALRNFETFLKTPLLWNTFGGCFWRGKTGFSDIFNDFSVELHSSAKWTVKGFLCNLAFSWRFC